MYRRHEGARAMFGDLYGAFAEIQFEFPGIRDLGDQLLAIGYMRARGKESGAKMESAWAYLVEFKDGKAIVIRTFLDPKEALKAAGLRG